MQEFESILGRAPHFAALLPLFLRCPPGLQRAVAEMAAVAADPSATEDERERACGAIAGALLCPGVRPLKGESRLLAIPPDVRAALDRKQAEFARRLRGRREKLGLTQAQLAEKAGVGQSQVSMLETGRCRPSRASLERLAKALGVRPELLWPAE